MNKNTPNDHDLLVTLNVKLDALTKTVSEIADGTRDKLADHEKRLEEIEKIKTKYPADAIVSDFLKLKEEVHDDRLTSRERATMLVTTTSVVTFILTTILATIGIITGFIHLGVK